MWWWLGVHALASGGSGNGDHAVGARAAPWCAPCRGITPLVQSLSEKLSSTTFVKVNVDEVDDFMEEYSVVSLSTFLLYSKDGSQAPTVTGTKWETIEAAIYGVSGAASTASGASTATKPAAPTAAPTSASTKQSSTPNGAASASPATTNSDERFTLRLMSNYEALKAAKSEALAAGRAVVIQCSAEWCRPCQFITPKMQELSAETPGIAFFKVDVDEVEDIMDDYKIVSLPTFLMWNADGTKAAAVAGSAWPKIKGAILAVNPSPQVAPGDAGAGAGAGAGATSRSLKRPRDEDSAAQPAGASKQARPTSLKLTAADIAARVAALVVPAEAASVVAAFDEALPTLSAEEARALYSYKVPMLSTDGGCRYAYTVYGCDMVAAYGSLTGTMQLVAAVLGPGWPPSHFPWHNHWALTSMLPTSPSCHRPSGCSG